MPNPFAKYARGGQQPVPDDQQNDPAATTPAPVAAPAPAPASGDNPFAQYQPNMIDAPGAAGPKMEDWHTTVRGKYVSFQAPHGADTATVRAAAKAAGVGDASARSLKFGQPPAGPSQEQKDAALGPVSGGFERGVDFVMPFVDELASGASAAGLNPWARPDPNKSFGDNYTDFMHRSEDVSNATDVVHPDATRAGRIGAVIASLPVAAESKLLQGGNWLTKSLRMAAAGGAVAGTQAYGNNSVDDRWNGVPLSVAIGTGIGALTPAASSVIGSVAKRVDQRLGVSEAARRLFTRATPEQAADQSAVDVLAARVPQKPTDMRDRVQAMRDTGHAPTLVNALDESGRGMVAAMARRPGAGRQIAQDAYDARRLSMPERIDRNMVAAIDSEAGGNADVAAALKQPVDTTVAGLKEQRNTAMEAAMKPIRSSPVPLSPRMFEILNTADGQRAIGQAMRTVTDQPTLKSMRNLQSAVRAVGSGGLDPNLPASAHQQIMAQLTKGGGLTVDTADRLARKFNAMADTAPSDTQRALRGFATEIRDHARTTVPEYDAALKKYATTSKSLDAVDTGSDFVTPNNADDFAARAGKLSNDNPVVKTAQPTLPGSKFETTQMTDVADPSRAHEFTYTAPNGEVVKGRIGIEPNGRDAAIDIAGKPQSQFNRMDANRIGPSGTRDILRHIAGTFPDLETIGGYRVSGARHAVGRQAVAEANLDAARNIVVQPSDRQLAMQAARRAVQQAAGENISSAPSVARKFAVSPEQSIRTNALFSPLTAEKLSQAMGHSEQDLQHFARIAPNTGSATILRGQDDNVANAALTAMAHLKTGNVSGAVLHGLRTIGVRDQDAANIVRMAVDPARTDELINMLQKSYDKQTAQKIGRLVGLRLDQQVGQRVGGSR